MDRENKKMLAIGVDGAKITAEKLKDVIVSFFKEKEVGTIQPTEKSYEDFNTPGGVSLINFSITETNISTFQPIADEHEVNYSLKKDMNLERYYVCFQSNSMEQIYSAMKAYVNVYENQHQKAQSYEQSKANAVKTRENAEKQVSQNAKNKETSKKESPDLEPEI